jgi:hypothetical protein
MRNARKILNGKPERGIPLKRYRLRWDYNIKMDLKTIGENLDWILLVRIRGRLL